MARLAQALANACVSPVGTHASVADACRAVQRDGGVGRVLVFGSFHTVEQALRSGVLPPAEEGWGL